MPFSTEPIYQALFDKVKTTNGIVTATRRAKTWADIDPVMTPALFMIQIEEKVENSFYDKASITNMPGRWTLRCVLLLYCHAGGGLDSVNPVETLNPIKDAIRDKLESDMDGLQTLGGLVHRCRVVNVQTFTSGEQNDLAECALTVEIYLTDEN